MYESDAKALAGKEQREMEKLFGKKSGGSSNKPTYASTSSPSTSRSGGGSSYGGSSYGSRASTGKKWQPKSGGGELPSMFKNANSAVGASYFFCAPLAPSRVLDSSSFLLSRL